MTSNAKLVREMPIKSSKTNHDTYRALSWNSSIYTLMTSWAW